MTHRRDLAGRWGDTEPPHSRARLSAEAGIGLSAETHLPIARESAEVAPALCTNNGHVKPAVRAEVASADAANCRQAKIPAFFSLRELRVGHRQHFWCLAVSSSVSKQADRRTI